MTDRQARGADFEERLLSRLKAGVAERGAAEAGLESTAGGAARPRWRHPARLALGAAVVLVVGSGGDNPSKAFAVEPQKGGGVTIEVYSPEDAPGLEGAFEDAGIKARVSWLAAGMTCREPRFTPSKVKTSFGGSIGGIRVGGPTPAVTIGLMSHRQLRKRHREFTRGEISEAEYRKSTPSLSLDPASFRPDQSVVVFGTPRPYGGDPVGGFEVELAIAKGPVAPCRPVAASAGSRLPMG